MNNPISRGFRFPKIEHLEIVAGPPPVVGLNLISLIDHHNAVLSAVASRRDNLLTK
jgi:hypothetical protein